MVHLLLTPLSPSKISHLLSVEQLSPNISLYRPKVSTGENGSASTPSLKHPNLILLFSWTGAQQKHITKYTSGYFARFPSTPIMVITTSINDLTYRTSSKKCRVLLPCHRRHHMLPNLQHQHPSLRLLRGPLL